MTLLTLHVTHHDAISRAKLLFHKSMKTIKDTLFLSICYQFNDVNQLFSLQYSGNLEIDLPGVDLGAMTGVDFEKLLSHLNTKHSISSGVLLMEANLGEDGGEALTEIAIKISNTIRKLIHLPCITYYARTTACVADTKRWAHFHGYLGFEHNVDSHLPVLPALEQPVEQVLVVENMLDTMQSHSTYLNTSYLFAIEDDLVKSNHTKITDEETISRSQRVKMKHHTEFETSNITASSVCCIWVQKCFGSCFFERRSLVKPAENSLQLNTPLG